MYFDLFIPFSVPQNLSDGTGKKSKKDKGKAKAAVEDVKVPVPDYWSSITQLERERSTKSMALAGHRESSYPLSSLPRSSRITLYSRSTRRTTVYRIADVSVGYDVVGCTITSDPSSSVIPNPFSRTRPFPDLDPRSSSSSSTTDSSKQSRGQGRGIVQVTRFHIRLDDHKTHCFVSPLTRI